jgi:hypothetical protein
MTHFVFAGHAKGVTPPPVGVNPPPANGGAPTPAPA